MRGNEADLSPADHTRIVTGRSVARATDDLLSSAEADTFTSNPIDAMERGTEQRDAHRRPDARTARYESVSPHLQNGRSLGSLFRKLTRDTRTLVREQFRLAKMEASEIASDVSKSAIRAGAGGFIAYAGFLSIVGGMALLLGQVLPLWLSFSVVGLVVLIIGYALLRSGTNSLQEMDYSLDRTAQTLQEDKQWMKHEAEEVKRDPSHLGSDR